jgi:Asp/Glu/hydantoin racemase
VRLLLYNPNSDRSLTGRMERCVSPLLDPADELAVETAEDAPRFIGSPEAIAAARTVAIDRLAKREHGVDAVLLGCFGDLGMTASTLGKPFLSLWDACLAGAARSRRRFGIVTTSPFWAQRLDDDVRRHGLAEWFAAVATIAVPPTASAADLRQASGDALRHLAKTARVDVAVPGGALLAVLRAELMEASPLPLFDSFAEAIRLLKPAVAAQRGGLVP